MNKNNAKDYLPLVQALAEGKIIQILMMRDTMYKWEDAMDVSFSADIETYRIKPELKYRPWRPSEVPLGAWIKSGEDRTIISGVSSDSVYVWNNEITTEELLEYKYQYSIDQGKTWQLCGVLE